MNFFASLGIDVEAERNTHFQFELKNIVLRALTGFARKCLFLPAFAFFSN